MVLKSLFLSLRFVDGVGLRFLRLKTEEVISDVPWCNLLNDALHSKITCREIA